MCLDFTKHVHFTLAIISNPQQMQLYLQMMVIVTFYWCTLDFEFALRYCDFDARQNYLTFIYIECTNIYTCIMFTKSSFNWSQYCIRSVLYYSVQCTQNKPVPLHLKCSKYIFENLLFSENVFNMLGKVVFGGGSVLVGYQVVLTMSSLKI